MKPRRTEKGYGWLFRILWPVLRNYRGRLLIGMGLILATTGIEIAIPIQMGRAVDIAKDGNADLLLRICFVFLGSVILKFVLDTIQAYVIQSTGQSITHDMRGRLFQKILSLPIPYYDKNPSGRLLTRVVNDVKSLSELFTASISVLALDVMVIVATLAAMFAIDWKLALSVLIPFPVAIVVIFVFGNRLAETYREVRLRLAEINAFLGESVGAISTVQMLSAEKQRNEKFFRIVKSHESAQVYSVHVFSMVQPITNVVNGISMAILLGLGGYWAIRENISVGVLVIFLGYLRNLFQPIRDLVEKYNTFLSAMVSAERIAGIFGEASETVVIGASPRVGLDQTPLRFQNVFFRYPGQDSWALDGVNLEISRGTALAVVGATGGGKSTLIRLVLKFYEAQQGKIEFFGRALEDWNTQSLRQNIGIVHQELAIFRGTIRDNLNLGKNYEDRRLIDQCKRVQLWDLIAERGGLDFSVLEGGSNLSLGERQLLSLARVLVSDPPFLILDEATSSVDNILEKKIIGAIFESLKGRTAIVIAHRLATVRFCHQVAVVDKGKIVELGEFADLAARPGQFKDFHTIDIAQ